MTGESHTQAQVTRRFDAAPEQVFDAWLKPEQMRKFFFTSDPSLGFSQGQDVQNDPRVGGTYRVMDLRDGKEYVADGEYLEIDRPRRLVFTFWMAQFSDSVDRLVIEIMPQAAGCELTLTQHIVMPHAWLQAQMGKTDPLTQQEIEEGLASMASETAQGWGYMLDGLAMALA